jgi:hypothetical protein
MTKLVKIAFVDIDTGEFYVKENSLTNWVFNSDVSRAKLYLARPEVREFFNYVAQNSKRNLKCVEVEVVFNVLGDSKYLDFLNNRDFQLYQKLNQQAEDNIDAMKETDYRKWKSLRLKFNNTKENVL